jgi:hypothetical protein
MLRDKMLKILLQQYRHQAAVRKCPLLRERWPLSVHLVHAPSKAALKTLITWHLPLYRQAQMLLA